MVETLFSVAPFRGLITAIGMTVPTGVVLGIIYVRFPDRRYLGALALIGTAALQSTAQFLLVLYGGVHSNIELGMQIHRITAIFSATALWSIPFFVETNAVDSPRLSRIAASLKSIGAFLFIVILIVAFVYPSWFVSVSEANRFLAQIDLIDRGRGVTGFVYSIRNVALVLVSLFTGVAGFIMWRTASNRTHGLIYMVTLVIATLMSLDDLYRLLFGHYSGLFTHVSYARFGVSLGIISIGILIVAFREYGEEIVAIRERSEKIEVRKEQARIDAYIDEVSGLENETALHSHLQELSKRNEQVAITILDIVRFRVLNGTYGSGVGDEVIRAIAERVAAITPCGGRAFRRTGGRYAIVLPDSNDLSHVADSFHERIVEISAPVVTAEQSIRISLCGGVALGRSDDIWQVLSHGEAALSDAKRERRIIVPYDEARSTQHERHRAIVTALRSSVPTIEEFVHYQAITDRNRRVVGFEALLRWNPGGADTVIGPGEYIPIAEELGLVGALSRSTHEKIFNDMRRITGAYRPLGVNINLSARLLQEPGYCALLAEDVRESGIDPRLITFELTESAVVFDTAIAIASLSLLQDEGCRISLDDFGARHSSFAYIRDLPLDQLKLDRAFIIDVDQRRTKGLVSAVVELAHRLGIEVVAEGIETETQFQTLRRIGCDRFQGYLLARPTPPSQLDTVLLSRKQLNTL